MIKQTTLHNILTWVIAVILFIFQSLNFFIAWIKKKYVKHGEKTTTVVTADTTISCESNPNNKNEQENVITVQGLIQKHFDIPLIIAEDEPKVYNFIKSAQLLTSNKICKEKKKIDQFMKNLIDDSYVARGLGLITATVGRLSEFYLYSKYDNNFENIVIRLSGRNGEVGEITILSQNPANIVETKSIPIDYFYDKDRIKVTYTPFAEGVYILTLVRNSLSICRSPYYISVEKSTTNSRSQIRLGTKKYKPVTKFVKAKHSPLETCDNSIPVIEPSKSSICGNILPASEENSIRTDVMSIVTKFESNNISVQKKVYKNASSIPEKGLETDLVDDTSMYSNIKPKIENDNICYNNVSDLNSHNAQSKSKSTDKPFWNDVDVTYRNSKASDINDTDIESERIKKHMTNFNKNNRIAKDLPFEKNVLLTPLKPTHSVLEESLYDGNSHDVEKRHQTLKTAEFIDKNTHIETLLDPTARIDEYEIKCIDNEPCIQNEVSCFDDDDRKTVVVLENINEIESNLNDTVIQQITDSAQYTINTPFASVITKITKSVCETCSIQVLKILSEFPRDVNITHDNDSKEMTSSFETLLAQPISININIDNMFEHPISATKKNNSEHLLPNSPPKIKSMGTTDKDIKCQYLNEIEPIDNNSDNLCGDINNPYTELIIKTNKPNSEISKTIKDKIIDHCTVPFTENTIDKHKTVEQKNEILKIKYSTTNEENVLHSDQFNNDIIHKSDSEKEIQGRCLQKSSEHNMGLIKTNQFHENINKELNNIRKECNKPLDTSDLVTINNDKNTIEELVITDEFKINDVGPDKNTNIQSFVVNNTVLESMEVTKYNLEDNKEQTKNMSYKNVTLALTQNEKQKLMIEKSIEPVITSFKNKMVEKITQLYLNKDLSSTDNTTILETRDKHLINNMKENQINNVVNNTEINTTCIKTLSSQLKNHIDKNEISEIILDKKNSGYNHLFQYVENIIKTNINPSNMCAQTLAEKKLQTLVNTAMNHPNYQPIDNEIKKMIIDNETQDAKLKKMNNGKIVFDSGAMLVETQSVTIIKNSNERIPSKNELPVKTECKLPLINDFNSIDMDNTNIDIKQEIQTINENITMVKTNGVEIKELPTFQKSHNTAIITPIIELQPTLETQIINTTDLVTVGEHSLNATQTTIEIIESNIPEKSDVMNECEKMKPIPPFANDTSVKTTVESKTEKNKLNNKLNSKYNLTTIESTVNEISCNNTENNTTLLISSSAEEVEEKPVKNKEIKCKPIVDAPSETDLKVDEKFLGAEGETTAFNVSPTTSSVRKIVVEFVTKNNKKPVDTLAITVHEQIKEKHVTAREKESTTHSLTVVMDEQDNIKTDGSHTYYSKVDDKVKNTETKTRISIDQKNAEKNIEIEPLVQINSIKGVVVEKIKAKIGKENKKISPTVTSTKSVEETKEINKLIVKFPITSTIEYLEVSKEIKDIKDTKKTPYINSSTVNIEESPTSMISSDEVLRENTNVNIDKESETLLLINTSSESVQENKEKDKLIETLLPMESTVETIDDSVEDIAITSVTSCTGSVKVILDVRTAVKKFIGEESSAQVISIGEKHIDQEPNVATINYSDEVIAENVNGNIDTEKETLPIIKTSTYLMEERKLIEGTTQIALPTKSSIELIEEPKIVEDIIFESEITSCIESLTDKVVDKKNSPSIIAQEPPVEGTSSDEVVEENTTVNNDTENKTTLFIESIAEPEVEEDRTEKEILSFTDSSNATIGAQMYKEKYKEEESAEPINSSNEVLKEKKNVNIDNENELLLTIDTFSRSVEKNKKKTELIDTLLPMESTIKSIEEPVVDITDTTVTSCTDSSNIVIDVQTYVEKVIGEESSAHINSVVEKSIERDSLVSNNSPDRLVAENTNGNIDTEKETSLPITLSTCSMEERNIIEGTTEIALPIESSIESIEDPKSVEDIIIETVIISCTESLTEVIDDQNHPTRIIDQELPVESNSSVEVVEDKTTVDIDTENKYILSIELVSECVEEYAEKVIGVELSAPIDFVGEKNIDQEPLATTIYSSNKIVRENVNVNIDNDNKTILPIDTSYEPAKENNEIDELIETVLRMESTVESIKKRKIVEDITETEITSCTKFSTEVIDDQNHTARIIDQDPLLKSNSADKVVRDNTSVDVDTENNTPFFIKSIAEPEVEDGRTEKEILSFTASSNATIDAQMNEEKYIEEESPTLMISSNEVLGENNNVKIDKESETLLLIDTSSESVVKNKEKNELIETLLPMESIVETIDDSVEDIAITSVTPCTDSSNIAIDVQTYIEKVIGEESSAHINSVVEKSIEQEPLVSNNSPDRLVAENTNGNIDKEKETSLPITLSTCSMEEQNVIEGTTEIELAIKSTLESTEKLKVVTGTTETKITSCIESSTEIINDQIRTEKNVSQDPPLPNDSSDELSGENMNFNIHTEKETHLPIESVIDSTEEPGVSEGKTEIKIPRTDYSTVTIDAQTKDEKYIEVEQQKLINSLNEVVGEHNNVNINKEDGTLLKIDTSSRSVKDHQKINELLDTLLPIDSTVEYREEPIEDITVTAVTSSEDSTNATIDVQKDVKIVNEEESSAQINSLDGMVVGYTNANIDIEYTTTLPIESVIKTVELNVAKDITETKKPSTNSSIVIVDAIIDANERLVEGTMTQINSLGEVGGETTNMHFNTEQQTLAIKRSTDLVEERKAIEGKTEISLTIESSIHSIVEPNVVEDKIFETEITSSTESSTEMIEDQNHTAKIVDREHPVKSNSSVEVVGDKTTVDIDTENKTLLSIESVVECAEEDIEQFIGVESSAPINFIDEKYIKQELLVATINSLDEIVGGNMNVNIHNENETILPIDKSFRFVEENKKIAELIATLFPNESTIKSIEEPVVDVTDTIVTSCTDSSNIVIDVQTYVEKVIGEESSAHINSVVEKSIEQDFLVSNNSPDRLVAENTNGNIDTEKETSLPITLSTCSMEERNIIEGTTEIALPIESSIESIEDPKSVEDIIIETVIISCTESLTEVIDDQNHPTRIIDQELPVESNSSVEVVEDKTTVDIDTENKYILSIELVSECVEEYAEKVIGVELSAPIDFVGEINIDQEPLATTIYSSNKIVRENVNVNIDNENETILPIDTSYEPAKEINEIDELIETVLPMESTVKSIKKRKIVEDITETEITSCTKVSTEVIDDQNYTARIIDQDPLLESNSADKVVRDNTSVDVDTENNTPLFIKSITEPIVEDGRTEKEILSFTDLSNATIDAQMNEKESTVPINSSNKVLGGGKKLNINKKDGTLLKIDTSSGSVEENQKIDEPIDTLLPMESTVEYYREEPIQDITVTAVIPCTDSSNVTIDVQKDVKKVNGEESSAQTNSEIEKCTNQEPLVANNSPDQLVIENRNGNIDTKKEILSPIKTSTFSMEKLRVIEGTTEIILPTGSTEEPKVGAGITETEITSCTESSTEVIDHQNHASRMADQELPVESNSSVEVIGDNTIVDIDNENETLLPIDTSYGHVKENNEIDELIETLLPIESTVKSKEKPKVVEDKTVTEITSCTESSSEMIDDQNHADKNIDQESVVANNSSDEVVGENMNVPIDTIMESIEVSMEVECETKKTPCSNSSTVTIDVQTDVEKFVGEESSATIFSLGEVVGENTNVNTATKNVTISQIDISTTAVATVIKEKVIENEYSIPIVSSFLVAEKQINVIDSTTETLSSIETYMTVVEEPNMVECVPVNEHSAHIDSSTTSLKEQIKIDSETEIETLSLIDNLTESVKEQIVEKNTENKTPALIDSLSEITGQGNKVDIDTDNQTLLPINTFSTTMDCQIVKNVIENKTVNYCSMGVAEEETRVNIENNIETITPIDNFTAPVEEQLNVEYLSENDHTARHIDLVTTAVKNQTKLDIHLENATLLSIDTRSVKEQLDEVEETIQNDPNLLIVYSTETELKGYDKLTDIGTGTTSIGALNTTENRQTFKKIEVESGNETSTPVNYSASVAIEQTDIDNLTEKTLLYDDILNRNTKTNLIGRKIKTENSDNPNSCFLKFGETSKMHSLENEDNNLQRKSYGIQKLEMSVQRMKTSDEDYYEKTFLQLEQTEKMSKVDKFNVDGENKTIIDDKLYTVNESDLNAILCASSLEEALTLLDSKIKFKFKHKKSSRINSKEYIPKIQTSDSKSSDVNTNFTDAREFFKEIEKKSKK